MAGIDCEVDATIERHSHAIVIGRVLDITLSARNAALAYRHGRHVSVDQGEGAARLAEVSVPARRRVR